MTQRGKGISPQDQTLWKQVADTVQALHPASTTKKNAELPKPSKILAKIALKPFRIGSNLLEPVVRPALILASGQPPLQMDRRSFDRMRKGRLRPEAVLDLHGMTADVAHGRLNQFIIAAHQSDLRLVLVITGKGRVWPEDSGTMPLRKGVLRHSVPHWLAQAGLRARILQVTQAHDKHGGGGALYVYLRRRRVAE